MLAILAFFSDIPAYVAALISQLTGADMSAFTDLFNNGFANIIEALEQILTTIG
ncbi:MAG: hypothetical protein IJZ07_00415 [Clostridia bacterium]|nr:hypothetical protein [Clostridia bacterium]